MSNIKYLSLLSHARPSTTSVWVCSSIDNMFIDIKDTAMKTVKQRNMVNREMKLAIGDELQTLFHPIVNATKQAAEETRKEFTPMRKTLTDIDGALTAQRATDATTTEHLVYYHLPILALMEN